MKRTEIKQYAKSALKGNLVTLLAVVFVQGFILAAVTGLPAVFMQRLIVPAVIGCPVDFVQELILAAVTGFTTIFSAVVVPVSAGPLALGGCRCVLAVCRGEKAKVSLLFEGFRTIKNGALLYFMRNLLVLLWTMLLIIPGIIAGYNYSMAFFLMSEDATLSYDQALKKSKQVMQGHKMELFALQLSFIGWYFLIPITLGLAALYVVPYLNVTLGAFYNCLVHGDPAGGQQRDVQNGMLQPAIHQEYYYINEPTPQTSPGVAGDNSFAGATTILSSSAGTATTVLSNPQETPMGLFTGIGPGLGDKLYSLVNGQVYYVGRESTQCGILVEEQDASVSRCHCAIEYVPAEGGYYVTDLSSNGTFVNGQRIPRNQRTLVHVGDTIAIGNNGNGFRLG